MVNGRQWLEGVNKRDSASVCHAGYTSRLLCVSCVADVQYPVHTQRHVFPCCCRADGGHAGPVDLLYNFSFTYYSCVKL